MSIIDIYFGAKKRVHEYFGYVPGWKEIPMEDGRRYHWMLIGNEIDEKLVYSGVPFVAEDLGPKGGNFFSASIYKQCFLTKYVYRNQLHTMISIDTHVDGNKFLMILTNSLECTDEDLKNIYKENW